MSILIVEDNPTNRKLLRAQLESEGFSVVQAVDGVEALEAVQRGGIDLVISDILMPNMDGFRLCHEIRRTQNVAGMPFILYTSTYNSPADRRLAETVGADHFVAKPAPLERLVEAIAEAMSRKDQRRPVPTSEHDENYVLKRYNEALVRKLEEKNNELETALAEIHDSHQAILALNAGLESRVERRTRQLAETNRELEAFTFSVSHDLRAPLRRIDGYAHVLEARATEMFDEEGRHALITILKSVREMGRLIQDLLAFSRTGRVELKREVVDLETLVDDVLGSMTDELEGRRIVWDRQPLAPVRGDPSLLRQVFVNLLGNAVKYTRPRDPAHIGLSLRSTEEELVTVCVRDDGVGFDMARAGKLFGVFQRLHADNEFEGTGIGLAIVQRIVSRHGGRIWAEATPGQGASFFFTLPSV